MSVTETVLVYGVIPLVVFLAFAAATLIPGRGKDKTDYRPGQPWSHEPVWYEPHPDAAGVHGGGHGGGHDNRHDDGHDAIGAGRLGRGATALALTTGEQPYEAAAPRRTAAGGARGTW